MKYANANARAEFCTAAGIVDSGAVETFFAFKSAVILLIAAAIALAVGIGLAKVCTDCLTQEIAYADPIVQTVSVEESDTALLAETLKNMGAEAIA